MRKAATESRAILSLYHLLLLGAAFAFWYAMTTPGLVSEEFAKKTAFFFGKPLEVLKVIWVWFRRKSIRTCYNTVGTCLRSRQRVGSDRAVACAVADGLGLAVLYQSGQRNAARDLAPISRSGSGSGSP